MSAVSFSFSVSRNSVDNVVEARATLLTSRLNCELVAMFVSQRGTSLIEEHDDVLTPAGYDFAIRREEEQARGDEN